MRRNTSAGRPREEAVEKRILDATLKLLTERGYLDLSIEAVAAQASVSKRSIYLRYRTKAMLATVALANIWNTTEAPDSGSTYTDLELLLQQGRQNVSSPAGASFIGYLIADANDNKEAIQIFEKFVDGPRRALYRTVLERGIRRGDVRGDIDIDFIADLLRGPYYARILSGLPIPDDFQQQVVKSIWHIICTSSGIIQSE